MTTGFVLAMGRSGTMWTANALRSAAGLDARHETAVEWSGGLMFGDVEVNSFFWNLVPEIRTAHPGAPLVHLVRDGRDVVRSVLSRKPGMEVGVACEEWRRRNHYLRKMVGTANRFRLENLTERFSVFESMACVLGGAPNFLEWEAARSRVANPSTGLIPPFGEWPKDDRDVFWSICEAEMMACGYGD